MMNKYIFVIALLFSRLSYSDELNIQREKIDPFPAALVVIQNKCFQCHKPQWKNFLTSKNWIDAGLVTPSNFKRSELIYSLKNYGGDMPFTTKLVVTKAELKILKKWINSLK